MKIFHPTLYLEKASQLTLEQLAALGVRGLILDIDNTLTTHGNPVPDPEILLWLEEMKKAGIKMVILSNNYPSRVKPFAEALGLGYKAGAAKPLTYGFRRASKALGVAKREIAIVGDQVFTDVLGGNIYKIKTVLVKPILLEKSLYFSTKRGIENKILKSYLKRLEVTE